MMERALPSTSSSSSAPASPDPEQTTKDTDLLSSESSRDCIQLHRPRDLDGFERLSNINAADKHSFFKFLQAQGHACVTEQSVMRLMKDFETQKTIKLARVVSRRMPPISLDLSTPEGLRAFAYPRASAEDSQVVSFANVIDRKGFTPLLHAALAGNKDQTIRLLNAGADPFHVREPIGRPGPLNASAHIFRHYQHTQKMNPNGERHPSDIRPNNRGMNVIAIAADRYERLSDPELLEALLNWATSTGSRTIFADLINAPALSGKLPLAIAIDRRDARMILRLLESGADLCLASPSDIAPGADASMATFLTSQLPNLIEEPATDKILGLLVSSLIRRLPEHPSVVLDALLRLLKQAATQPMRSFAPIIASTFAHALHRAAVRDIPVLIAQLKKLESLATRRKDLLDILTSEIFFLLLQSVMKRIIYTNSPEDLNRRLQFLSETDFEDPAFGSKLNGIYLNALYSCEAPELIASALPLSFQKPISHKSIRCLERTPAQALNGVPLILHFRIAAVSMLQGAPHVSADFIKLRHRLNGLNAFEILEFASRCTIYDVTFLKSFVLRHLDHAEIWKEALKQHSQSPGGAFAGAHASMA